MVNTRKYYLHIKDSFKLVETQIGGVLMVTQSYSYIRVSTKEQKEDRQLIALRQAGIPEKISI